MGAFFWTASCFIWNVLVAEAVNHYPGMRLLGAGIKRGRSKKSATAAEPTSLRTAARRLAGCWSEVSAEAIDCARTSVSGTTPGVSA